MNDFFVSASEHLPRLGRNHKVFDVEGQLPDEYVIDLTTTLQALGKVKTNKATRPDNVPAWILKNHANILAGPLTAIFNSSLREGIIPDTWKSANIIPVPKVNLPNTIEKDVRPISLTPIASKTLKSIILNMVNEKNEENINCKTLVEWEWLSFLPFRYSTSLLDEPGSPGIVVLCRCAFVWTMSKICVKGVQR